VAEIRRILRLHASRVQTLGLRTTGTLREEHRGVWESSKSVPDRRLSTDSESPND
jgi:hypothetical protein